MADTSLVLLTRPRDGSHRNFGCLQPMLRELEVVPMPGARKSGGPGRKGSTKTDSKEQTASNPAGGHPPGIEDAIRNRAYQLYEQRGGAGGSPMQDWLDAEAEVLRGGKKR